MPKKKKIEEAEEGFDIAPLNDSPELHEPDSEELQAEDAKPELQIGDKAWVRVSKHLAVEAEITAAENEAGCFLVKIPSFKIKFTPEVHRSRIYAREPKNVAYRLDWSRRLGERLPRPLRPDLD